MMRVSEIPANCDVLVSGLQCLQVQRQEFDWLEVFEGSVCCISGFVELPFSCLTSGFVFDFRSWSSGEAWTVVSLHLETVGQ